MSKRRIIASVINNYNGDQRVQKQIRSLSKFGFETQLIATDLRGKPELKFDYPVHCIHLKHQEGMQLYLEFNRKLYSKLKEIVRPDDILLANDLDALLPNYLISKSKKTELVFDSHEIFSELPSLNGRPFKKKIWKSLEQWLVPKMEHFYTVSEGYAGWFEQAYGKRPQIIRNVPEISAADSNSALHINLPEIGENEKLLIYQGAINMSRGIDKMIQSMQFIDNAQLWIIGNGPKEAEYRKLAEALNLNDKVKFTGAVSPADLKRISPMADLGFSLEEDLGISYRYALPNKLFDYMHAGVPVLGTALPDIKRTIEQYKTGRITESHQPEQIAELVKQMLAEGKAVYSENLKYAASIFNWENEEKELYRIYEPFLGFDSRSVGTP